MKQIFQRYALALFWLAQEENQISEFMNECQQILKIFAKNPDFLQLVKNDALKKEEKKEILSSVFKNEIPSKILYFMNVIVDHHREKYIQEIIEEFIQICLKHLNIKKGTIYSTIPLSDVQIQKMEEKISTLLKSKVILQNQINKELIGGFKIEVEDWVLDYSIQEKMKKMKENLLKNRKE